MPWRLTLNFIKKQSLGAAEVQTIEMSSYDNALKFDQCNCTGSSSCKLPNGTRPDDIIDIGKYIDFWTTNEIRLPYILLGLLLLIIMYVVVESCVSKQISVQKFILGPEIERNDQQIDNEGLCDLIFEACNQQTWHIVIFCP